MATKCSKPEDHEFRFDEETPMEKGVFMVLQCEKCGIVASGLLKFRKHK